MTNSFSGRAGGAPLPQPFGEGWRPAVSRPPVGRAPVPWLVVAAVTAAAAIVLAVAPLAVPDRFPFVLVFVAWVLAGPLTILLLAVYTSADVQAQARTLGAPPRSRQVAYRIVLAAALVGIVLGSWSIATFVGRL